MKVIGVNGYARAGKDTVGAILTEDHGYERRAFADKLKELALAVNPVIHTHHPFWSRLKDLVTAYGWEEAKAYPEVRRLMQGFAEAREVLHEDVWLDAATQDLQEPESIMVWQSDEKVMEVGGRYVFTDCRYPNEAKAIKALGGEVWRVHRPGVEASNGHSSETSLDDWTFDAHLFNEGTIDDLHGQVQCALYPPPAKPDLYPNPDKPTLSWTTLASDLPVDVIGGDGPAPRKVHKWTRSAPTRKVN